MKKAHTLTLLLFALLTADAQQKQIDSTRLALSKAKTDTEKYIALAHIGVLYGQNHPDSVLIFDQQAFLLAKKNNWIINQAKALNNIANDYLTIGDYVKGTQNYLRALKIDEELHDLARMALVNANIGISYSEQHDFKQSLAYTITSKKLLDTYALTHELTARQRYLYTGIFCNLGELYVDLHHIDSAEKYSNISYGMAKKLKYDDILGSIQDNLGKVAAARGKNAEAARFFRQALASDQSVGKAAFMSKTYLDIADLYHKGKQQDSAEYYAKRALETAESGHFEQDVLNAGKVLYTYYDEDHNLSGAYKYFKMATAAKDSLYSQDKVKQLLSIDFDEKMRQQELQTAQREAQKEAQNKLRTYVLSGGLGVLLLLALIFWRNSNQRKNANRLLSKQKEEIAAQRDHLETKNRELEMETALERVRARTMAMQKSDELKEIIKVVYEQLVNLNVLAEHAGFIMDYKANDDMHIWLADKHYTPSQVTVPYFDSPHWNSFNEAKAKGLDFFANHHTFEEKNKFYQDLFKLVPGVTDETKEYYFNCPGLAISTVLLDNVGLYIENFSGTPYTDEENASLMRFGKVFQQTYTRFLDLQKAEEQAREAEVQLALERVRARTMAMQRSNELSETAYVLHQQFSSLGNKPLQITIGTIDAEKHIIEFWATDLEGHKTEKTATGSLDEPFLLSKLYAAWKNKKKSAMFALSGRELKGWVKYREQISGLTGPELQGIRYVYLGYFSKGAISISTEEPLPEETVQILERFAAVFDGTYTRFLDLQKAEAQARESQIEAALERVRSRTMAMHNSQDVAATSVTMFQELVKLGVESTVRCGVSIISNKKELEVWTASLKDDGSVTLNIGHLDMKAHPLLLHVFTAWQNNESSTTYELTGGAVRSYFQALNDAPGYPFQYPMDSLPEKWGINAFFFPEGCLFAFTGEPLSLEMSQLFKRFAGVFGQTYRRYLDLQKAEAQAREAQIEAALERVRSRTLAMQKSDELAETAAVLFRQMISLGIEPNRLYIGITREESTEIEFWITDEDGSKVSTMFSGDSSKNKSMKKMRDAWEARKKSIVIDMHGDELTEYFHYLGDILQVPFKGGLTQKRRVQYISYFSNGFIGMASPDEQPEETIKLLERFAGVFNLTFIRFHDLKIAEAHAIQAEQDLILLQTEKKRAEDALTELKSTQTQLVQREKMASLGELTAGIAHEIQNPLNFVNNFSEVSRELMGELIEELDKGDTEEAKAITQDVIENLAKINHHGRRADSIVKGMLEHSRVGTGQKQPTDLNTLADEFLKLSYHGLRAKDKSFNAEFIAQYDAALPKANVVQQDMGRVLLNLFNNAFYAVNQKLKIAAADYKPIVEVSTSNQNGQVIIKVKDNGTGIPDAIKEKILQPFFTTKPTGEGTGLGLSLSYDILVKGHNGTLDIISKEGEGSEFIVKLPVN